MSIIPQMLYSLKEGVKLICEMVKYVKEVTNQLNDNVYH